MIFFNNIYNNKKVFITGHTGFKGSWLSLWLERLGAQVTGYSLDPPTEPNHFSLLKLKSRNNIGNICDFENLSAVLMDTKPDIVFHLAAQPIVRLSYANPIETFKTNVIGTLNVFEACKKVSNIKAIINVTSDKCYQNNEWIWGYRETDPMGGYDPYSASKGCSELLTSSYRNSFFNIESYGTSHNVLISSVRAGNVIGGGDWAEDRLIPDIMRAASTDSHVIIRSPHSIRPWQHVLEPLSGYLLLGKYLLEGRKEFAGAWNFGPDDEGNITVENIIKYTQKYWDKIYFKIHENANLLHESRLLKLDCSKAHTLLQWRSVLTVDQSIFKTVDWYKSYYEDSKIKSTEQIESYCGAAKESKLCWIS